MRAEVSVLVDASSLPTTRDALRETLDALWSEEPGTPIEVLVRAREELATVVTREHRRRAALVGGRAADGRHGGEVTAGAVWAALARAARGRTLVFLGAGARVTPGWAHELARVAGGADEPRIAGPRLSPGAAPSAAQAALELAVPPGAARGERRAAASKLRFLALAWEAAADLSPVCVAVPRRLLDMVGGPDGRYESSRGATADLERRARAVGAGVVVARRAAVLAPPLAPLPEGDAEALARRAPLLGDLASGCPGVALELEADDGAAEALRELADALVARGVPLRTFATRTRTADRPSEAPHVQARSLASAVRGAAVVLARSALETGSRVLRLALPGEAGDLVLEDRPGPAAERLDAWALAVRRAARASGPGSAGA